MRRYNEDGEKGYYTRFKYGDDDGNVTSTSIPVRDIIQLRKIFLEANPNYFETVYGYDKDDDL